MLSPFILLYQMLLARDMRQAVLVLELYSVYHVKPVSYTCSTHVGWVYLFVCSPLFFFQWTGVVSFCLTPNRVRCAVPPIRLRRTCAQSWGSIFRMEHLQTAMMTLLPQRSVMTRPCVAGQGSVGVVVCSFSSSSSSLVLVVVVAVKPLHACLASCPALLRCTGHVAHLVVMMSEGDGDGGGDEERGWW